MRNYIQAYKDVCRSGCVFDNAVSRYIEQLEVIDQYLPESDSFFYIMDLSSHTYKFIGKQQKKISGFDNDEFHEKGIELFAQRVHPDDVGILLTAIYPAFIQEVAKLPLKERKNIQGQYNFRFRRKSGEYLHIMEQVYILELDENGNPSLLLGNAVVLNNEDDLSLKLEIKKESESGYLESIFAKTFRPVASKLDILTKRERDVLIYLLMGKTSREIGDILFISRHTVDTHRRNILKKLECESAVDLLRIASNEGLV